MRQRVPLKEKKRENRRRKQKKKKKKSVAAKQREKETDCRRRRSFVALSNNWQQIQNALSLLSFSGVSLLKNQSFRWWRFWIESLKAKNKHQKNSVRKQTKNAKKYGV